MTKYTVFSRTWWKPNKAWPGGREPHAGRKRGIRRGLTIEEARALCASWNKAHANERSGLKAEFTAQ